jgi:hypothetical protein
MTTAIYDNCYTCWNDCPTNPGNKCGSLRSLLADANCIGLASNTAIADFDIVTACRQVEICTIA